MLSVNLPFPGRCGRLSLKVTPGGMLFLLAQKCRSSCAGAPFPQITVPKSCFKNLGFRLPVIVRSARPSRLTTRVLRMWIACLPCSGVNRQLTMPMRLGGLLWTPLTGLRSYAGPPNGPSLKQHQHQRCVLQQDGSSAPRRIIRLFAPTGAQGVPHPLGTNFWRLSFVAIWLPGLTWSCGLISLIFGSVRKLGGF